MPRHAAVTDEAMVRRSSRQGITTDTSSDGSEVGAGGVTGVARRERTPIRPSPATPSGRNGSSDTA